MMFMRTLRLTILFAGVVIVLAGCSGNGPAEASNTPAPISIEGLRDRIYDASFVQVRELVGSERYRSDLMTYYADSLKIFTLINTPVKPSKSGRYPVLIFGHGFHPDPAKYGVSNATGEDWRPGDYYRGIPTAYAEAGFLVVTPDYRGHNKSDGFKFTQTGFLASAYYAIDVLHAIEALKSLPAADTSRVFYLGHSMGGDVGLRMLLASRHVKAASLWAPVAATSWEQALYYGKYYDKENSAVNKAKMTEYTQRLKNNLDRLDFEYTVEDGDPIHFLAELAVPLIIHHARGDASVPYIWSESLAAKLFFHDKTFQFYTYPGPDHLFKGEDRRQAVLRDIDFFNQYMSQAQ